MKFSFDKNLVAKKLASPIEVKTLDELKELILKEKGQLFNAADELRISFKDSPVAGFFEVWASFTENVSGGLIQRCAGIIDGKLGKPSKPLCEEVKGVEHVVEINEPNTEDVMSNAEKSKGGRPKKTTA